MVADFANSDVGGKLNVIGGAFQFTARAQIPGLSVGVPPMAVVAIIDLPAAYGQTDFTVVLTLKDSSDTPVEVPSQVVGGTQALRVSQIANAKRDSSQPAGIGGRVQIVMALGPGIPLQPDQAYYWELQINGHTDKNWRAGFYVQPDPPQPILG